MPIKYAGNEAVSALADRIKQVGTDLAGFSATATAAITEAGKTAEASGVTFEDGETFQDKLDNGTLKGPQGDTGKAGGTGPQGPAGPNEISTSTKTTLSGILKGTGTAVALAKAGTDYAAANHTHAVLTFNGGVSKTYNGSAAQTVTIPTIKQLSITIPTTGWTADASVTGYSFKCDVSNTAITAAMVPILAITDLSKATAMRPVAETAAGKVTVWAKTKPTVNLTGTLTLLTQ